LPERPSLRGELGEDNLSNVLREVGVPINLAQRSIVDDLEVSFRELGEGWLGVFAQMSAKDFGVILHRFSY
jgi:hypothetical protein